MKKLALLILVVTISSLTLAFTSKKPELNNTTVKQELREEIIQLLKKPNLNIHPEDIKANVIFTINSKNEIVILNVYSNAEGMKRYLKSKLNYKKIKVDQLNNKNQQFKVSVHITKPEAS